MTKILDWLTAVRIDATRWVHANMVLSIIIVAAFLGVCFIAVAR